MSVRRARLSLLIFLLIAGSAQAAAQRQAEIPRLDFLAEGVAIAPHGLTLVSGVQGRTILRLRTGQAMPWLRGVASGGLFGMAVDAPRNRLWIAETGGDHVPGGSGAQHTGVLEVRLSDGNILADHAAPEDGKPHWIGDLVLAQDGAVYASDSQNGQVYRLKPGGHGLQLLAQTTLKSPQGVVVTADGKALILGDYATGLHRVDLATGEVGPALASTAELRGLDGLKRHGRDLIATQNGSKTQRVLRVRLSPDERSITGVEVLAAGPELLEDVSLGDVAGDRFVFVARSGWAGFDDDGRPNSLKPRPPVIAEVALPPGE
jgi:sugar lactone lactonase YvrE